MLGFLTQHFFGSCPAQLLSSPASCPLAGWRCGPQLCGGHTWSSAMTTSACSAPQGAGANHGLWPSRFWLASAVIPSIDPAAITAIRSFISGPGVWWGRHGAGALTGKWFILIRWLESFLWNSRREDTEVSCLYSPKSHHHLIKIQLP